MGGTDDRSRLTRLVEGQRRSGLELIVGPARYVDDLIRNSFVWIGAMVVGGGLGLLLAGPHLGVNRGGITIVIAYCVVMMTTIRVVGKRAMPEFFPLIAISAGFCRDSSSGSPALASP